MESHKLLNEIDAIKKERDFWKDKYHKVEEEVDNLKARIRNYEISKMPKEIKDALDELDSPGHRMLGVVDSYPPEVQEAIFREKQWQREHLEYLESKLEEFKAETNILCLMLWDGGKARIATALYHSPNATLTVDDLAMLGEDPSLVLPHVTKMIVAGVVKIGAEPGEPGEKRITYTLSENVCAALKRLDAKQPGLMEKLAEKYLPKWQEPSKQNL
jgi:hypothetical protein